jgi:N-acetylneuraminic acid mutarotase
VFDRLYKSIIKLLIVLWLSLGLLLPTSALPAYAMGLDTVGPWKNEANALPQTVAAATSVVYNGYVYFIGGFDASNNTTSTVYSAPLKPDGSVGTWTTESNALPQPRVNSNSVAYNGYVYVMGGYDGSFVDTVYSAPLNPDGSVGAWTTELNALPVTLSNPATVVYNGYVYVMGGFDGTNRYSAVYSAPLNPDGSVGAWTTELNPLPQVRSDLNSVVYNGQLYAIGGFDGTDVVSTVYSAPLNPDGSVGTWRTDANALPHKTAGATSVVYNGHVYFMGGSDDFGFLSTIYSAPLKPDGSVGTWTTESSALPQALFVAASVAYNGYVYVMGGYNGSTILDTVYSARFLTPEPDPGPSPNPVMPVLPNTYVGLNGDTNRFLTPETDSAPDPGPSPNPVMPVLSNTYVGLNGDTNIIVGVVALIAIVVSVSVLAVTKKKRK